MTSSAAAIHKELHSLGNREIAEHSQRFFKTGKGEYGEGDRFVGVRVPIVRKLVRRHRDATLAVVLSLLKSPWHEERQFAVLSLVDRFVHGDNKRRKAIFDAYMGHRAYVNNWDLVDCSARDIVGGWLETRSRRKLYTLAKSPVLWDRRIAIIATCYFIQKHDFEDTLQITTLLLDDSEGLIQKATGWMLREVGNRAIDVEVQFLQQHYRRMPRTMLRYAIEKFPKSTRKAYLAGTVV